MDLASDDEERWDSKIDEALTIKSSYPPLWHGNSGPAETSKEKTTDESPKRWRRADWRSKRAGVRRNRVDIRSPSAADGSHAAATRVPDATKEEQVSPPFGCCFWCWKYGQRYYQCSKPQKWAFRTKCGRKNETTTSCVQYNVAEEISVEVSTAREVKYLKNL